MIHQCCDRYITVLCYISVVVDTSQYYDASHNFDCTMCCFKIPNHCDNRERSGTIPSPLVEANEKAAFGMPSTSVDQFLIFEFL